MKAKGHNTNRWESELPNREKVDPFLLHEQETSVTMKVLFNLFMNNQELVYLTKTASVFHCK